MREIRKVVPVLSTLVTPWVLFGSLVVAAGMLLCTLSFFWLARPSPPADRPPVTAVLSIIKAPTSTPTLEGSPSTVEPVDLTRTVPALPVGENIAMDVYVQVVGTGGDGLRLRSEPGLNGQVRLLGSEAEVFQVKDGPVEKDGYSWWYLVGPFDQTRAGWAVANFLVVVPGP